MELTDEQLDRFWNKVAVRDEDDCWEWSAGKNKDGYGAISVNYKGWSTHRLSWTIHNGDIPDGLYVLHTCDNPACVNPSHLFLGTHTHNMRDMIKKGRAPDRKGENGAGSKLTNEKVIAIFYEEGTQESIAKKYDIDQSSVSLIKNRKTWTPITKNL